MILDGSFTVDAPIQEVWDFLIDIPRMSVCFPGMQKVEQTNADTYRGVVAVRVRSITASFQGTVAKTHVDPPNRLVSSVHLWDAITASVVTGTFTSNLSALAVDRTQVDVHCDLSVRGRLNQLAPQDFRETFQRLLEEFAVCVRRRIERPANHTQWTTPRPNRFQNWLQSLFAGFRARSKTK